MTENKDKELMKKLVVELVEASNLYYNGGESPLSDKEFDRKLEELRQLEEKIGFVFANSPTINVGAPPVLDGINQVQIISKPMLSLDKVHTAKEVVDFSDGYDIMGSIKCDGLSVRLIYEDGNFVSANTRGNGTIGSNITEHIKYFLNVPLKINKKGRYIIDGEAIIYDKDFEIVNKDNQFMNSRNTAAGSLSNLLDMSIFKDRRLSFIAWDVIEGGKAKEYHYNIEEAEELGFTVVPMFATDCTCVEEELIDKLNEILLEEAKEKGIPCDGVVWRINDIPAGEAKGRTAHHWCNAVAWKPADEEYDTELLDIELSMGRTGMLTPVAVFKGVNIDGSYCSRASLHNISIMTDTLGKHPYIGQKIRVYKSNKIIPQIGWADLEENHVNFDALIKCTCCPICGSEDLVVKDNNGVITVWCNNPDCAGKLVNKIDYYCGKKGLDIKGLSKKTIEKLCGWGWLNSISELYDLQLHRKEWISKPSFGQLSVDKILSAIEESKRTQLDAFIVAIGIPLVGRTVAKEITKYYETWNDFRAAVGDDWTVLDGFGPEISKAINSFDYKEFDNIAEMLTFEEIVTPAENKKTAENLVFCVTGKVTHWKNRDELKSYIESIGGKVVGSITSKVNYLINNDVTSQSSKNVAALKNNIPIINEEEFIEKFGQ